MISSPSNPLIKSIRKLRERKERESQRKYYVEGLRIIGEAAQSGAEIDHIILCRELLESEYGLHLADHFQAQGLDIIEVSRSVMQSFSLKEHPQGMGAVIHQKEKKLEELEYDPQRMYVALDSIADPGNLGTIMRTLDAVGGKGIILLDHCTDAYDPTAVRSSMGSIFHLELIECSFLSFSTWAVENHIDLIGTSDAAEMDYQNFIYPHRMILLMGSERQGLQPLHFSACAGVVRIPMIGSSDSLNVAVAAAVVLYEIFNQRLGRPIWKPGQ